MENIDKDFDERLLRDVSLLDRLTKEKVHNYQKILLAIKQRHAKRIFWRVTASCAAVLVMGLFFYATFSNEPVEKNIIAEKLDALEFPMLITESGEEIALKNDNSYTLEYAEPSDVDKSAEKPNVESAQIGDANSDFATDKDCKVQVINRNTVVIPNGYTYNIRFDDGTVAHINSGSYIEYPRSFANREKRVVSLTGEGYFKVARSDKPFIVKANGLEIKVYGTEFNLNTNKENRVEVILVSGSVGVKKEGEENEQMLAPCQRLVFNVKSGESCTQNVEPSDYLGWMKGDFTCSNSSMYDLMDEICAFYGISIDKDASLADKMVTISLSRQLGFKQIMEIMEPAFGLKFTQIDKMKFMCKEQY